MDPSLRNRQSSSAKTPISTLSESKRSLSIADTPSSTVAIEDDADTPSTTFTGVKKLYKEIQEIRNVGGGELYVERVTPVDFSRIIDERSEDNKCRLFFSAAHRALIITIPSGPHEQATGYIVGRVDKAVWDIGLQNDILKQGAKTFTNPAGQPYAGSSEGDASYTPILPDGKVRPWPSLVLEVGYTESIGHLRMKADWWLVTSGFDVKVVLLVKLTARQGHIRIEKWKGVPNHRTGATTTRSYETASRQPGCVQTVIMSRPGIGNEDDARLDPSSYIVARGPLRVGFIELFLREPGPGEYDIVFDEEFLKDLAVRTWI